ncbi:MAG: sigma-70 family RNA polymerase sigma factor [Chitinophagales bacterium]
MKSRKPAIAETEFRRLFELHYPELLRYLARLTGEAAAGEDLAQEVFLKLYFDAPEDLINPRAWLYKVATNTGYNYLRKQKNLIRQEVTGMEYVLAQRFEDPTARSLEILTVRDALENLSWRDRTCLLMKHSGYSYAEISEVLGIEKSSVGTILVRAQEKFRRELEGKGGI